MAEKASHKGRIMLKSAHKRVNFMRDVLRRIWQQSRMYGKLQRMVEIFVRIIFRGIRGQEEDHYPLVEWDITEAEALQICYDRGFYWDGLYELYRRCSCWCCPFQRIDELRTLRHHHPELWAKLRDLDERAIGQFGHTPLGRFKDNWSVEQLEQRFAVEDAARKEAEMEQDKSGELRDMFKGIPPKNVIIAVDDLPPKTLEQHMKEQKAQEQKPKKHGKSR